MIVIGIDPGTVAMGYGIIESKEGKTALIDCGALTASSRSPIGERLSFFYKKLTEIMKTSRPEAVAIETPFVSKNVKTALAIGRAQATAILAAANLEIEFYEYSPAQIKQRVANYGAGSKEQIQQMVKLQLGLDKIPEPNDAADALAVALCHLSETHVSNLLSSGRGIR